MSVLSLNKIRKNYGISEVLKEFSLFVNEGGAGRFNRSEWLW